MIKLNRMDATSILGMLDGVKEYAKLTGYPRQIELSIEAERLMQIIEKQL